MFINLQNFRQKVKRRGCGKSTASQVTRRSSWVMFYFVTVILLQILERTRSNWHSQWTSFISTQETSSLPDVCPWLCCFLCLSVATLIATGETNAFIRVHEPLELAQSPQDSLHWWVLWLKPLKWKRQGGMVHPGLKKKLDNRNTTYIILFISPASI